MAFAEAVEIAAREIERLGKQDSLMGEFDAMDLERFAKICLNYDHHNYPCTNRIMDARRA